MAYLHCHNCDWEQDDFWHDGYNPVSCIQEALEWLFQEPNVIKMDNNWCKENGYGDVGSIKATELAAHDFERQARKIRGMVYRTEKEFYEKNPERKCPKCGQQQLDID